MPEDIEPEDPARLPADETSAGPLPAGTGAPAPVASITLILGFVTLAGCLFLLGTLAEAIRGDERVALDAVASPFLHALASPGLDTVMWSATFVGSNPFLIVLCVVATALLLRRDRPGSALFLDIATGGSLLLNELMKQFFQRPRPQLPWSQVTTDFSFPSGHTMNSTAVYVALAVIVWSLAGRRRGGMALAAAIALATLIGISRIYLGYHYFSDVVGGALASISWLLIALGAFRTRALRGYWPKRARLPERPRSP